MVLFIDIHQAPSWCQSFCYSTGRIKEERYTGHEMFRGTGCDGYNSSYLGGRNEEVSLDKKLTRLYFSKEVRCADAHL
jgi:hypothetical protein